MRDMSRTPFTRYLAKLGFKRVDSTKDPLIYEMADWGTRGRRVDVQLWRDGGHRASNVIGTDETHWRESTVPTNFSTVAEMDDAIAHEWTRKDHPPLDKAFEAEDEGPIG